MPPARTSTLYALPPEPYPRRAGWLDESNSTELGRAIIERAFCDIGIRERPLGSNRGVRIDRYVKRAGLKPPVYWCAVWAGIVWADAGALVPRDFPDCDVWLPYLRQKGYSPVAGDAILYGKPGDARHIEIVARNEDGLIETIGGNRGYAGDATNNGVAVIFSPVTRKDVLGFVSPRR